MRARFHFRAVWHDFGQCPLLPTTVRREAAAAGCRGAALTQGGAVDGRRAARPGLALEEHSESWTIILR